MPHGHQHHLAHLAALSPCCFVPDGDRKRRWGRCPRVLLQKQTSTINFDVDRLHPHWINTVQHRLRVERRKLSGQEAEIVRVFGEVKGALHL